MSTPFPSARAKYLRAEEHHQALQREIRKFLKSNPYPISHKRDADGGKHLMCVKVGREPNWERWGLLLGDYFHNLRSALDHVLWQLRVPDAPADDTVTQFPIFDSFEGFRDHGRRRLKHLRPRVQTLVKWLQPYRRPIPPDRLNALLLLNDMDIFDKHKVLIVGATVLQEHSINVVVPPDTNIEYGIEIIAGYFKDGAEIAQITITPPNPKVKVKGEPTFGIVFGQSATPGEIQHFLLPTLAALSASIDGVLSLFERLAPRLYLDRGRKQEKGEAAPSA
jgi:hypothetical protein